MFKILLLNMTLIASFLFAGSNIELKVRLVKPFENENLLYMESETARYKIIKSELTKEGVAQILKNRNKELTIFIPEKAIKSRVLKQKKE